jgi:hypothetical protein
LAAMHMDAWTNGAVAAAWEGYAESMVREVASRALKPRQKLPVAELREKLLTWHTNPPQVDRRLREVSAEARTLLAVMHVGKRQQWRLGALLEIVSTFRGVTPDSLTTDGLKVVEELVVNGLLVPVADESRPKLGSFAEWLSFGQPQQYRVWVASEVMARAAEQWEALPELKTVKTGPSGVLKEADCLEWFLRLAVAWQRIHDAPARLTQQGVFFKRDHDRFSEDTLLNQPLAEFPIDMPQLGHLIMAMGLSLGIVQHEEPQVVRGAFPQTWADGWKPALLQLLGELGDLNTWSVSDGWCGLAAGTNPWPSSTVLVLSLLLRMEPNQWTTPTELASWLSRHHCYWSPREHLPDLTMEMERLLLGILLPMKLVQAGHDEGQTLVRLTSIGRELLSEKGNTTFPDFPKTLLVQPNMEMVAYRQGLSPKLVRELSHTATWKALGAACLLTIDQHSVHRGLEAGATFDSINTLLDQHCVHPPPGNVLEALRTWAAKRDRLAVYQGVNLLEFLTKADLDEAVGRGLKGVVLADRYLLIEKEEDLEYRHFRTLGTRDYTLPPTQCVTVENDGVTLQVDPTRADLLLETELLRFSAPLNVVQEARQYRATYASLDNARSQGLSLKFLGDWFVQRTGMPITAAIKMLWSERNSTTLPMESILMLRVASEEQGDGLWQWPETRTLLEERLGPCVFRVLPGQVEKLREKLSEVGLSVTSMIEMA